MSIGTDRRWPKCARNHSGRRLADSDCYVAGRLTGAGTPNGNALPQGQAANDAPSRRTAAAQPRQSIQCPAHCSTNLRLRLLYLTMSEERAFETTAFASDRIVNHRLIVFPAEHVPGGLFPPAPRLHTAHHALPCPLLSILRISIRMVNAARWKLTAEHKSMIHRQERGGKHQRYGPF